MDNFVFLYNFVQSLFLLYTLEGSIIIFKLYARWQHCSSIGEPVLNDNTLLCSRVTVGRRAVLTVTMWQFLRNTHLLAHLFGFHIVLDLVS